MTFGFNVSNCALEPAQLCKSEQRPSSLPVGPVVASLGNQTPTPNSTGTVLSECLGFKKPKLNICFLYMLFHPWLWQFLFVCLIKPTMFNTPQEVGNQHRAAASLLQAMSIFLRTQFQIFLTQAVRMNSMMLMNSIRAVLPQRDV